MPAGSICLEIAFVKSIEYSIFCLVCLRNRTNVTDELQIENSIMK